MLEEFLIVTFVPLFGTIVMAGMRTAASKKIDWNGAQEGLAWDLAVLGLGLVGAVAANPNITARFGVNPAIVAVLTLLLNVLIGVVILLLQRTLTEGRKRRLLCLFLGFFAVAAPTALTLIKAAEHA